MHKILPLLFFVTYNQAGLVRWNSDVTAEICLSNATNNTIKLGVEIKNPRGDQVELENIIIKPHTYLQYHPLEAPFKVWEMPLMPGREEVWKYYVRVTTYKKLFGIIYRKTQEPVWKSVFEQCVPQAKTKYIPTPFIHLTPAGAYLHAEVRARIPTAEDEDCM